jgi:hypothetical protein
MSFGKHTLLIEHSLLIKLFDASLSPVEKGAQAKTPARTINAWRTLPSAGSLAIMKISILRKGSEDMPINRLLVVDG